MTRSWIAIGSLALTALGTVFAGMQLWVGSGSEPSAEAAKAAAMPIAEGLKADCGIASQTSGTVNIDCSKNIKIEVAPTVKSFDKFDGPIDLDSYPAFQKFVGSHRGKIVEFSASMEPVYDSKTLSIMDEDDGTDGLTIVISEKCEEQAIANQAIDCGGVVYNFSTKEGGEIYWANGEYKIDGYFSVEPTQGLHRGYVSVFLRGVSSGQARLTDPTAR